MRWLGVDTLRVEYLELERQSGVVFVGTMDLDIGVGSVDGRNHCEQG